MTKKVIIRTYTNNGSRVTETTQIVPSRKERTISRSRAGGASIFRREQAVYSRICRAVDGYRKEVR